MLSDSEVCDAKAYQTERKPLDIYMMIDNSGSMVPWWPATLESIDAFFSDPASAGVNVGLQFFGESCDIATYSTPAVPMGMLPGHGDALRQAFPIIPISDTATRPALQGAIAFARQHAQQNPDHKVVVLLVTDGLPEECDSTVDNVTEVAREGFAGTPSIQTYVVGIGDVVAIDRFAQAGGTGKALLTAGGAANELSQALNAIRSAALPCDFELPRGNGIQIQPDRVNLRHLTPDGRMLTIGAVRDASQCDATRGGWYFDNPAAPSRVVACEQSCKQLNAGGEAKVLLGCPTQVILPS